MIKLTAQQKKNILYLVPLIVLLIGTLLFYFFFVKVKPNDKILVNSSGVALYSNENPTFVVDFGNKEDPNSQWIRFEASSSDVNPFKTKNKNIFTEIANIFTQDKKSGIEMSLKGIDFSETRNTKILELGEDIKNVADILGTDDIKTSTQVIESGRDIAIPENEQNISKPTIVNSNVADGVDVEYQILEGKGLKEEIILQNLDSFSDECKSDLTKCKLPLNTYTFDLKMDQGVRLDEGWYLVDGKTTQVYYFTDSDGKYLAHFLPSFAEDSNGNKTSNVDLNVAQTDNGDYEITVTVDSDWLLDANRVYPVRIDPSIVHDTSSDFSTGTFYATKYITGTELQISDPSIVASWNMNETTSGTCSGGGDICDQSGNGYNATISGGVTSVASIDAYGRSFDGATGTLASVGDVSAFETNSFTIEAWVKKAGTCNAFYYCTILSKGSSGYEGWNFGLFGSSPVLDIRLNDKGPDNLQLLDGTTVLSDNTWYYVAVVVDGVNKNMKLYLNGQLEASGQYSAAITYSSASVKIGNSNTNSDLGFNGVLDDVRFSNVAKSQSYIQNQYKKEVLGIYRSPVIAINGNQNLTFSSLTSGVKTVDGETPYSTTGLVAQWNFNETSGTTAVSGGTCGTNCNGTPTNMTTTGQDAVVGTGWTANNLRWGAGALMFDGSDDYTTCTDANCGGSGKLDDVSGSFSIETWVKPNTCSTASVSPGIIDKFDTANSKGYLLYNENYSGANVWTLYDPVNNSYARSATKCISGKWTYIVAMYDSSTSTKKIYINGVLEATLTGQSAFGDSSSEFNIGRYRGSSYYFSGIIDSTRIYSRALTATEILSNYNVGSIEFQMRGGNTTNADDGTWSSWTTTTNETSINSFDNSYLYNTSDSGLIAYWPMDEATGTSVSEVKGSYTGTATGTTVVNGKYSNSRSFNGTSSDYISVADSSNLSPASITLEVWVKPTALPASGAYMGIVDKRDDSGNTAGYALLLYNDGGTQYIYWKAGNSVTPLSVAYTLEIGKWSQIVITQTVVTATIYVNGKSVYSSWTSVGSLNNYATSLYIGKMQSGSYFNGAIDEVQIYNSVLTASSIKSSYIQGLSTLGVFQQKSGGIEIEGTDSNRITNSLNTGLVSYWRLNESSGTSLADSAGSNTLTSTGTTVATGKYNFGRSFNGSSDYADVSSNLGVTNGDITIEAWVKPTNATLATDHPAIISHYDDTAKVDYRIFQYTTGIGVARHAPNVAWNSTTETAVTAGQWYQVTLVYSGTTLSFYLNGAFQRSVTATSTGSGSYTTQTTIGRGTANVQTYFGGSVDEVKIYNTAKTADEILEEYLQSSTYYSNYSLTSADLSAKTNLPFYIAADKPGSYISATVGESAYVNYQADANTVGLWHLDEVTGSGAYIKDSSGLNNNGTPTGTTLSAGVFGNGRTFGSTSDIVSIADNDSLSFTTTMTAEGWFKTSDASATTQFIVNKQLGGTYWPEYILYVSAGSVMGYINSANSSTNAKTVTSPSALYADGNWHHAAMTYDGSSLKLYVDGVHVATTVASITLWNSTSAVGIGRDPGTNTSRFIGSLDEVRLSNVTRTADQIRQTYEVGLRTHNVTIQFGARLSATNLIADSSDTSFTVDATAQGLTQMGSNLYTGDKLIVKEILSGTEYIAQGTISAINALTGVATVNSWDTGSTFPTGGFTIKASVFKWEKQYIPIAGGALSTQIDAISLLTLRITNTYDGGNIWIDDLKSNGGYIGTSGGTVDLGQAYQYTQYRAIFTSADGNVTPYLNQVQVDYTDDSPTMDQIMRHGQWFDSSGVRKSFWWSGTN